MSNNVIPDISSLQVSADPLVLHPPAAYSIGKYNRTIKDIKIRWKNLKQAVKEKHKSEVHHVTGGGSPPLSPMNDVQAILMDHFRGNPQFEGIVGGIDTFIQKVDLTNQSGQVIGEMDVEVVETGNSVVEAALPMKQESAARMESARAAIAATNNMPTRGESSRKRLHYRREEALYYQAATKKMLLECRKLELEIKKLEKEQ